MTDDFFRARLEQLIDLKHPLAVLASRIRRATALRAHRTRRHPIHFLCQRPKVDVRLDLGQRISERVDLLAVMLVGEQVGLDGGALLHGWRQRTKSGQSNFTNHRGAEVFRGALKSDNRMDRCWLHGQLGDALHAVLCAASYYLRLLLPAMVRLLLRPKLTALLSAFLRKYALVILRPMSGAAVSSIQLAGVR